MREGLLKDKDIPTHETHEEWTFHYLIPDKTDTTSREWKRFLVTLHDFKNFEDFWGIINGIEPAHRLPEKCRYYVFKKGVKPLWEDERNADGFEIYTNYQIKGEEDAVKVEEQWLRLVLSVMAHADTVKHYDRINGVEFGNRGSAIKVGLWAAKETTEEEANDIIEAAKNILDGPAFEKKKIDPDEEKNKRQNTGPRGNRKTRQFEIGRQTSEKGQRYSKKDGGYHRGGGRGKRPR